VHPHTNLTGVWVEYHGPLSAYHGHRFMVTDRLVTPHGVRYVLADKYGQPILTNIRPGSVTPARSQHLTTWAERAAAIQAAAADIDGEVYAAKLHRHLNAAARLVEAERYAQAQRILLQLEVIVGLLTPETYQHRLTELEQFHGPRQPRPPALRRANMFDEPNMVMFAACIICGNTFASDPHTVPSVWVNQETRCPVRPDGTAIEPGENGTTREPLCPRCAPIIHAAVGKSCPVHELFPYARIDKIHPKGGRE